MRISDWSSDVCSSDLQIGRHAARLDNCLVDIGEHALHRLVIKPPPGHFGRQLILFVDLVERRGVAAGAFEQLTLIGAREVNRRVGVLPRRGHFLARLVDLARRVGLTDLDRKSVVSGTRVSVRLALGGRRVLKKKNYKQPNYTKP